MGAGETPAYPVRAGIDTFYAVETPAYHNNDALRRSFDTNAAIAGEAPALPGLRRRWVQARRLRTQLGLASIHFPQSRHLHTITMMLRGGAPRRSFTANAAIAGEAPALPGLRRRWVQARRLRTQLGLPPMLSLRARCLRSHTFAGETPALPGNKRSSPTARRWRTSLYYIIILYVRVC